MKQKILIVFLLIFSVCCHAQFHIQNDTTIKVLRTFKLNFFKPYEVNTVKSLAFNIDFKSSTRFTLYFDSLNTRSLLYDNYRHEYIDIDPFYPYNNFESAVMTGLFNTLINLFYKRE